MNNFENENKINEPFLTHIQMRNYTSENSFSKNLCEKNPTNTLDQVNNVDEFENVKYNIKCLGNFNTVDNINDRLLSTKSTKKGWDRNNSDLKYSGTNSDLFFSGYFGPRKEDAENNKNGPFNFGYKATNPFPNPEGENPNMNSREWGNNSKNLKLGEKKWVGQKNNITSNPNYNYNYGSNSNGSSINFSKFPTQGSGSTKTNTNSTYSFSFENLVRSVSLEGANRDRDCKTNKKELKSTEELILEKIQKEKEDLKKLKHLNTQTAERCKNFNPKPIIPSPLTLIKPFNLSSSKMLSKKRLITHDNDKINNKIKDTIKRKCEAFGEKMKESVFINDKIVLNKTPTNMKYMKRTFNQDQEREHDRYRDMSKSKSKSKSPFRKQNEYENDLQSLSSRIERYCVISQKNKPGPVPGKSPLKLNLNLNLNNTDAEDTNVNLFASNILNTSTNSNSIRKHFSEANLNLLTGGNDASYKEKTNKLKSKPSSSKVIPNGNACIKKQPIVESFESILLKTRKEKQELEDNQKEVRKLNKMNLIKQNRIKNMMKNKENVNTSNKRDMMIESELMLVE
jgi:hypothetical protein